LVLGWPAWESVSESVVEQDSIQVPVLQARAWNWGSRVSELPELAWIQGILA
jgi:hypothetical protein